MRDDSPSAYNVVKFPSGGRVGKGQPPGPPLEPPAGGGGDDLEARVRVLETHVEYIKSGISKLEAAADSARSDLTSIQVGIATLTANVSHLPSKGLIVSASLGTITLIVGILTILSHFGLLAAGK